MNKSLLLFTLIFTSLAGHAVQTTDKKEMNAEIEGSQSKARKILESNFNAVDNFKDKNSNKPNFGFQKKNKENKENL